MSQGKDRGLMDRALPYSQRRPGPIAARRLVGLAVVLLGVLVVVTPAQLGAMPGSQAGSGDALARSVLPAPDTEGAVGLLSDVERIVDAEEDAAWFVDAHAYESLMPDLMPSVCRASPGARQEALGISALRRRAAGDARALFSRTQQVDDTVARALHFERQHEAMTRALAQADEQCPFWMRPQPGFRGRQTTRERFALSIETGGLGQLRIAEGDAHLGGGGAGRLLGSYRFGGDVTVLGGLEFGGGAMVRPNTSASEFVINYLPAVPLVFRFHDIAWHYEIETAAVGIFQADNTRPSFGARVGAGMGLSALRVRSFLPWAGFIVAGEHYFAGGGRGPQQFLRAGVRVGFFWDPE